MYLDIPIFKKCCCCIPLRYGLIVYGYMKLILMTLIMLAAILTVGLMLTHGIHRLKDFITAIILLIFSLIDIAMNIVFLKAAHLKNWKLFKLYYNYYFTFSVLDIIIYCVCVTIEIYSIGLYKIKEFEIWWEFLTYIVIIGFVNFVILVYILLLLRSELLKLQNNCQFRFVNETQEAQCMLRVNNEPRLMY